MASPTAIATVPSTPVVTPVPTSPLARAIFVDGSLAADCANGNYHIAQRACIGADGLAWRTVNAALEAAPNGALIWVRQGAYRETGRGHTTDRIAYYLDKPVTLKNYNDESVRLTFPPGQQPGWKQNTTMPLITITARDVTMDGFTIVGTKSVGDFPGDQDINIRVEPSAGNVVIRHNRILDFGHAGVKPHGPIAGPLLIEHNEFVGGFTTRDHGIYSSADDPNVKTIRYNFFHDISGFGVHIYHGSTTTCPDETKPRNHEVYGNVIVRNHAGGIVVSGPYNKIFNNVIYGNDGAGGGLWLDRGGAHHLTIKNNIIWRNVAPDNRNAQDVNADYACGLGNDIANNDVGGKRAAGNGYRTSATYRSTRSSW